MPDVRMTITGIQELQNLNLKRIEALKPSGAAGQAIKDVTIGAHRYAVAITHVWNQGENPRGGGLRASQRMEVRGLRGRIYIDPNTVNPRGQRPVEYGPHEHARGGIHAFYDRTMEEAVPALVKKATRTLERAIVYGR